MNGTAPAIRFILSLIAGEDNIDDCETADKLVRESSVAKVRVHVYERVRFSPAAS